MSDYKINNSNNFILVIGVNGMGLMPTNPRKARLLIKNKKAKIVRTMPFTIKLLYKTGCATQKSIWVLIQVLSILEQVSHQRLHNQIKI